MKMDGWMDAFHFIPAIWLLLLSSTNPQLLFNNVTGVRCQVIPLESKNDFNIFQ